MSEENENGAEEDVEREESAANDEAENFSLDGTTDLATLVAEVASLRERALRALAEADNTRKRAARETEAARQFAITNFARDLLSVSDNLNRALAACPAEAREAASDALKSVIEGVEATERELKTVLNKHGVKAVEAAGAKFDPNLHQAVAEEPAPGVPKGTIVTVIQGGYMIGERLLRAAMVTVAKGETPEQYSPAGEVKPGLERDA